MKKKLPSIFCALCYTLCLVFGLSACKVSANGITYVWESDGYSVSGVADESVTEIVIPAFVKTYPVTKIGDRAFYGCPSIVSMTIGNNVTTIGEAAFYGCPSLTSVIIEDSVTSIGYIAFYGSALTSVTIGNGLTRIEVATFYACNSLTSVTIGNGVRSIGSDAFRFCDSLTDIIFRGTTAEWEAIKKYSEWDFGTGNYTVHCTDGDIIKE